MRGYTVRSTYTHAQSAATKAADVVMLIFLCAAALFLLFRLMLAPVMTSEPRVEGLEDGEIILVDRLAKFFFDFKVGDLVCADLGGGIEQYRVAAPGGATVTVRGGRLFVNDGLLDDSAYATPFDEGVEKEFTVPQGSVLLLPDEREGLDLGNPQIYIKPVGGIYGKLRMRIYPLDKLCIFG